jgi:hypothetical protein
MAGTDVTPGTTLERPWPDPGAAARPGALVWLVRDGRFGRVVASAQGGLMCRVRPEGPGAAVLELAGCDLLPVAEDGAGERGAAPPGG